MNDGMGYVASHIKGEEIRENGLERLRVRRVKADHVKAHSFRNGFREDAVVVGFEGSAGDGEFAIFGKSNLVNSDGARVKRKVGFARDASEIDISSCHRRGVGSERIANKRAAVEFQRRHGNPIVGDGN